MDQRSPARSGRRGVRHPRESNDWSPLPAPRTTAPRDRGAGGATGSRLPPVRVRAAVLVVLAALLALAPTAPAQAAARKVPAGWVGVMADGPLLDRSFALEPEFDRMVADGVESVRTAFYWSDAQPYASWSAVPPSEAARFRDAEGIPTDFSELDRLVAAAAARPAQPAPGNHPRPRLGGGAARQPGLAALQRRRLRALRHRARAPLWPGRLPSGASTPS